MEGISTKALKASLGASIARLYRVMISYKFVVMVRVNGRLSII